MEEFDRDKWFEAMCNTYGPNGIINNPGFQGGFINFGYWKKIEVEENKMLTQQQRVQASEDLYHLVFEKMQIDINDSVLEIGCGRGVGCNMLFQKGIKNIVGIDLVTDQIEKAKKNALINKGINFLVGDATNTKFANNSFDKISLVESIQNIPNVDKLVFEIKRVIKSGGRIGVASHLSNNKEGKILLEKYLPTIKKGVDYFYSVKEISDIFTKNGFKILICTDVGRYVFKKLDQWIRQGGDYGWATNFYRCYKKRYMSYYLFVFEKL